MHVQPQHIPAYIQALAPLIHNYGYFGVGALLLLEDFGVPAPGETILIASAFYAGLGDLNILLVCIVGFLAAVIGDNIGFAIGEYGGHPLVERFGRYVFLTPQRLKKAEDFFNYHGGKIVTVARFVEGLRQLNGIIAGLSEMRWPKFITYNSLGAALWVSFWAMVGYFGGSHIDTFLHYQLYFTLAVVAGVILYIAFFIYRQKRHALSSTKEEKQE